ncbi:hypothetical protein [Pyxidicoccus trucidator]|uniref:hypothetical protein n=1 Tax=Pyxidicoccus trucidator TaxID=2709662 RepID=UPI001F0872DE|nr:hypothetical protein [Pyxidicoccus trucidator]
MASLHFLSAAGTVSGSKLLLEHDGRKVLVDCGLFQGQKTLRQRNWEPLPAPASSLDAIVLTHAPILRDPQNVASATTLVVKSTYGDRKHRETKPIESLSPTRASG